ARLVRQLEVEDRSDAGLARRELDGVCHLPRLVGGGAALREREAVGLAPTVERQLRRADDALEALLHAPDAHATLAGQRLRGAAERSLEDGHQLPVVALADRGARVL